MKVLHVHDFFAPGNSRYGHDLDRHLAARGHAVHVMSGVGPMGPADGATRDGITFHTYAYGFGMAAWKYLPYTVRQNRKTITRAIRDFGPDLLLFNQPLCANAAGGAAAAKRIPTAYSFISPWPGEYVAAHGNGGVRTLPIAARRAAEYRALRRARAIIAESRFVASELRRWHPRVPAERVHVVPGGVDPEFFHPPHDRRALRRRLGVDGRLVLFTMRRLVPRMGIDLLVSAVPAMAREAPEVLLWIGGDGPEKPKLEELARSLGVGDRVEFLGYVPDEALADRYGASDLFVLPSRALEGFGLVLIESLACGTPVVATRIGAIPEVLAGLDESGLTDPDATALARTILDRRGAGRFDRSRVLERYAWPKLAVDIEAILQEAAR